MINPQSYDQMIFHPDQLAIFLARYIYFFGLVFEGHTSNSGVKLLLAQSPPVVLEDHVVQGLKPVLQHVRHLLSLLNYRFSPSNKGHFVI